MKIKLTNCVIIGSALMMLQACGGSGERSHEKADHQGDNILEGGMTSGGGGTTIAAPASQEQISDVIQNIRHDLKLHLNFLTFLNNALNNTEPEPKDDIQDDTAPEMAIYPNKWLHLFMDDYKQTLALLNSVTIKDAKTESCFYGGRETDGSFHDNVLCISSYKISKEASTATR